MTEYITIAQVDELLGADWAAEDKKARAVLMANTWLNAKPLPAFSEVPSAVVRAGAEIAREAAAGALYGATETGVTSKSVTAGDVSSSKSYSSNSRKLTAGEVFAEALLRPYLGNASQIRLVRG